MEKKTIACEHCNTKFSFVLPNKIGVFRVVCPACNRPKYFKIIKVER